MKFKFDSNLDYQTEAVDFLFFKSFNLAVFQYFILFFKISLSFMFFIV